MSAEYKDFARHGGFFFMNGFDLILIARGIADKSTKVHFAFGIIILIVITIARLFAMYDVYKRCKYMYTGRSKTFLAFQAFVILIMAFLFWHAHNSYDNNLRQWVLIELIA